DSSARAVVPGRKGDGVKEYRWARIVQLISAPSNHSTSCTLHRHMRLGPLGQTRKPAADNVYPCPAGGMSAGTDPAMRNTARAALTWGENPSGGRSTRPPDGYCEYFWSLAVQRLHRAPRLVRRRGGSATAGDTTDDHASAALPRREVGIGAVRRAGELDADGRSRGHHVERVEHDADGRLATGAVARAHGLRIVDQNVEREVLL